MLIFWSRCSNSAGLELTAVVVFPLTSAWGPLLLTNLCAVNQSSSVWGGREALLLSPAGKHHCWPPTLPSSCFLTADYRSRVPVLSFLRFCLLYMKVLTTLERVFSLHLLTLLCACKWADLGFKRLLAVFKLSAVRHPWDTWPFYFLSPPLLT